VGASGSAAPDWYDASAYTYLLRADRASFAWEWLRRLPDYRSAVMLKSTPSALFGLCCFEDPSLSALESRPIWHGDLDRSVLRAHVRSNGAGGMFDIASLKQWTTVHVDGDGEHWRIGQGLRSLRLDIVGGTLSAGPVHLDYRIGGLTEAIAPVITLRRFLALACHRHWPAKLFPSEARAGRWITMLRVHDALAAGASQREIAVHLFGDAIIGPQWRTTAPSYRLRIQRLVAGANKMTAGAWRSFLDPGFAI